MICTDGLYGEVEEGELTALLNRNESPGRICDELIAAANRNGGSDNITMVVLKVAEEDINE